MAGDGVTIAQLADELGTSKSTVRRAARRAGVELVPGQVTRLDADQASAVAALVGRRSAPGGAPGDGDDAVRVARLEGEVARLEAVVTGLTRELDAARAETDAVRDALAGEREHAAYLQAALDAELGRPRTLWDRLFGKRALPAPGDRG